VALEVKHAKLLDNDYTPKVYKKKKKNKVKSSNLFSESDIKKECESREGTPSLSDLFSLKGERDQSPSVESDFSGFESSTANDQVKRHKLEVMRTMSRESAKDLFIKVKCKSMRKDKPKYSLKQIKEIVTNTWKTMTDFKKKRFIEHHFDSFDDSDERARTSYDDNDSMSDCGTGKKSKKELEDPTKGVYKLPRNEKVCVKCEYVSNESNGSDIIKCKGPCCGLFHFVCLGLSAKPENEKEYKCPDCVSGVHCCFICKSATGIGPDKVVKAKKVVKKVEKIEGDASDDKYKDRRLSRRFENQRETRRTSIITPGGDENDAETCVPDADNGKVDHSEEKMEVDDDCDNSSNVNGVEDNQEQMTVEKTNQEDGDKMECGTGEHTPDAPEKESSENNQVDVNINEKEQDNLATDSTVKTEDDITNSSEDIKSSEDITMDNNSNTNTESAAVDCDKMETNGEDVKSESDINTEQKDLKNAEPASKPVESDIKVVKSEVENTKMPLKTIDEEVNVETDSKESEDKPVPKLQKCTVSNCGKYFHLECVLKWPQVAHAYKQGKDLISYIITIELSNQS